MMEEGKGQKQCAADGGLANRQSKHRAPVFVVAGLAYGRRGMLTVGRARGVEGE